MIAISAFRSTIGTKNMKSKSAEYVKSGRALLRWKEDLEPKSPSVSRTTAIAASSKVWNSCGRSHSYSASVSRRRRQNAIVNLQITGGGV